MIGTIINGVLGIGKLITGGVEAVRGNQKDRDAQNHTEQMAVHGQFAAEFRHIQGRTWWDSFIDGLNRLPRPFMTFGMIALFGWAVIDPPGFTAAMAALAAVPEMLWSIFLAIVAFWFGGKFLAKDLRFKPPSVDDVKRAHDLAREIGYEKEMADTSKPLTNAAIAEWNARRRSG